MPTIINRNGKFLARVRKDGFKPVAKTFNRKTDAIAWGRSVEADMQAGRWREEEAPPPPTTPTVAAALALYRAGPVQRLKGKHTYSFWLAELERSSLATKPVNEITPVDLSAWRDEQSAKGLVAGTVVRKLGLISGFLTWCQKERGWLTSHPMRNVSKPRVNDARSRLLTDEEQHYLHTAAHKSRASWLADALVVAQRSAMRRGELWGVKVADINVAQSTVYLADTKNGSSRTVPLCPVARAALQRLVDVAVACGSDRVIPVSDPAAISLAFRRTVAIARREYAKDCVLRGDPVDQSFLDDYRFHDVRHGAASHWASTGGLTTFELQRITGHADLRSLNRYTHVNAAAVANKLAGLCS